MEAYGGGGRGRGGGAAAGALPRPPIERNSAGARDLKSLAARRKNFALIGRFLNQNVPTYIRYRLTYIELILTTALNSSLALYGYTERHGYAQSWELSVFLNFFN